METVTDLIFLGSKITADGDCSLEIKKCLLLGRKAMTNLDSILKSRGITLPTKICLVKAMVFPVVMYGCESWTIKKAEHRRTDAFLFFFFALYFIFFICSGFCHTLKWIWTVLFEETLESPFNCKEIQPVHPKGDQSWLFIGRTDAETEAPIFWLPNAKNWLIWKDSNARKDWRQ